MKLFSNRFLFNLGSTVYDRLTDQDVWREQVITVLQYLKPSDRPLRILDLGCGPGVSTFALAESLGPDTHIVGIDIAEAMIAKAQAHHQNRHSHYNNLHFQVADATALPFEDNNFDFAVGHSFLYLVPEPTRVLKEVKRVLRSTGQLVLMEPRREGSLLSAMPQGWRAWKHRTHTRSGLLRFATSMVAWRCVSFVEGQLDKPTVERIFQQAGFQHIDCRPTLSGLGWHCVGAPSRPANPPQPQALS